MSIQPKGEDLRRAVKWISGECEYNPGKEMRALIEEACVKFNLSPKDAEFLFRTMCEEK